MAGLPDVVAEGDHRQSLEAVRDRLAGLLESAEPRDAAALARQLTVVLEKLDRLPGGGEESRLDRLAGTVSDDLDVRRRARQSGTAGS